MQHLAKDKKDRAINNEILIIFIAFLSPSSEKCLIFVFKLNNRNPNFSSIKCRVRMVEIHVLMDHYSDSEFKRRVESEL